MQYVLLYGGLWAVETRKYKWLMGRIAKGEEFVMEGFGTKLADEITNISTMKPQQAQEILETRIPPDCSRGQPLLPDPGRGLVGVD